MWRPEELRERLRQRPFQPFALWDGLDSRYVVWHPELVMIGERSLTIGIPTAAGSPIYKHTVCIALDHVVRWEDLPAQGKPSGGKGQSAAP